MIALGQAMVAVALLALAPLNAQAQHSEATETSVKAAFLFKFAGYVEWTPADFAAEDAPLVIAVAGAEEIAADLARIVPGRIVYGHPVTVRKLREGESARGAHLVFVGRQESARLAAILRAAREHGVLAVTESDKGLELGAAINFVAVEDRVGFEVSLDSAEKSGHRISSRMLTVARRVLPKAS